MTIRTYDPTNETWSDVDESIFNEEVVSWDALDKAICGTDHRDEDFW